MNAPAASLSSVFRSDQDRLHRRRPRTYLEWRTLRRWGKLPEFEDDPMGYLLRLARERSGLSQREMAERLGCSQQAVAQAERWQSNPTTRFIRAWVRALGRDLEWRFG